MISIIGSRSLYNYARYNVYDIYFDGLGDNNEGYVLLTVAAEMYLGSFTAATS